jgi:tRNA U34 5-methylaminomethyl-2-thiouridine-forming methyltransferase MnmC
LKKVELIETRDGSSSLFLPELNETYHSTHGAIAEAYYVFIKNGIEHYLATNQKTSINILEIGFGTGLNALITADFASNNNIDFHYSSLEPFPLDQSIIEQLNYTAQLKTFDATQIFRKIHAADWGKIIPINQNFKLRKLKSPLLAFESSTKFDLIFFDAFAPSKQPEMWEIAIFEHLNKMMNEKAQLITYCAQGQFKRNLKSAGFEVQSLPGPPPKKEMVRGVKS